MDRNFGPSKITTEDHNFGPFFFVHDSSISLNLDRCPISLVKISVVGCNFKPSKSTVVESNFGHSKITVVEHNFEHSKITVVERNFGPSKTTIHFATRTLCRRDILSAIRYVAETF